MREYEKIETVFNRDMDGTKKLIEGSYRNRTVEFLKDAEWAFTEKIDGTNIRVEWDGHKVSFAGRTDKADIPKPLLKKLNELFGGETNEELFEQTFGEKYVILYGEGYGPKIQNGGRYREDVSFILFDIFVNGAYLERHNVEDIAITFRIDTVPVVFRGGICDAVDFVKTQPKSIFGTADMEGVVGRPLFELNDGRGNRMIVKIKVRDFV